MGCEVNRLPSDVPRYAACGAKTVVDLDGIAMCERHALEHRSDLIIDEPYDPGVPGRACLVCNTAWPASEADEEPWHHAATCPLKEEESMDSRNTVPAPPSELDDAAIANREAFERSRARRIVRLCEFAANAMALAAKYAGERVTTEDHRVCGCIRQAREYLAQVERLQAMTYADADTIVAVTLSEDLVEGAA